MAVLFTNQASSSLAQPIAATDTVLNVLPGTGALFPEPVTPDVFYLTIFDANSNIEIVEVTARNIDTFTVVRGQDGTSAQAFGVGAEVELRVTAAGLNSKLDINGKAASAAAADTATTANTATTATTATSAASATRLTAPFQLNLTGDVTAPAVGVDGSVPITLQTTLAPSISTPPSGPAGGSLSGTFPDPGIAASGVGAGVYENPTITVGADGRVTQATSGTPDVLAWAIFNSLNQILASKNVSSVQRTGNGLYTINTAVSIQKGAYAVPTSDNSSEDVYGLGEGIAGPVTNPSFNIQFSNRGGGGTLDPLTWAFVQIIGA